MGVPTRTGQHPRRDEFHIRADQRRARVDEVGKGPSALLQGLDEGGTGVPTERPPVEAGRPSLLLKEALEGVPGPRRARGEGARGSRPRRVGVSLDGLRLRRGILSSWKEPSLVTGPRDKEMGSRR